MQVLSKLAPLALLASTTTALNPDSVAQPGDFHKCYKFDNQIPWAINKLCLGHPNLKVPGYRTSHGQKRGSIKIHMEPVCNQMGFGGKAPPHHIGSTMCKNRFLRLCASSGSLLPNVIRQDFGGRCGTKFLIENVGGPRKPPPKSIKAPKWAKKHPKAHGPVRGKLHKHKGGKKHGHKGKKGHKAHGKKKHHKKKHGKRDEVDEVGKVEEVTDPAEIYQLLKASLEGTGEYVDAGDWEDDEDADFEEEDGDDDDVEIDQE